MKTASDVLHNVVNLTLGEKHEEALQVLKNWGCKIVDEVSKHHWDLKYDDEVKQRIQENKE